MTETTPHPPNRRLVPDPPLAPRERSPQRDRPGAGKTKVCVLGAGHGGSAMAAHLTLLGFEVTVCSLFGRELDPIEEAGGVELVGEEVQGFAKYARIERSLDRAVAGQDLIMIAAPGVAHRVYGTLLAPMLADGQAVVLNPGRTGGALEFAQMLTRFACAAEIVLGEVQTFVYAAESRGPASVEILNEKFRVRAAALPATENDRLLGVLQRPLSADGGGRERPRDVDQQRRRRRPSDHDAAQQPRARGAGGGRRPALLQEPGDADDREPRHGADGCREDRRRARARALRLWSVERWYQESYHVTGEGLWDSLMRNPYYEGFHASSHLLGYNHVLDEIPNSLVPVSELGAALGVPTPTIDAIVDLACAMCRIDFRKHGRTLEVLGLDGMTADEILHYVNVEPLGGEARLHGVARSLPWFA